MPRCLAVIALLLLSACAGQRAPLPAAARTSLPDLASLPGSSRTASALYVRSGDAEFASGGDVTLGGGTAQLASAPDGLSWVVYQFDTSAADDFEQVNIEVTGLSGQVWFAISEYGAQHWDFSTSLVESISYSLPAGASYSSPGHTYVAVLAHGGSSFSIESVALELAGPRLAFARSVGFVDLNETLEFAQTDPDGNLFAAGTMSTADSTRYETQVAKFAPDGSLLWRYFYHTEGDVFLTPRGMVSDGSGGMVLLLTHNFTPDHITLMRINHNSIVQWVLVIEALDAGLIGNSLARDAAGHYLISGTMVPNGGNSAGMLLRVFADGIDEGHALIWEDPLAAGVSASYAFAHGGAIYQSGGDFDTAYLHKFALDWNPQWSRQWPVSTVSYAPFLAADTGGGILVGGSLSDDINNVTDFAIIDFDPLGNIDAQFGYRTPFAFSFFSELRNAADGSLLLGVFNGELFSEAGLVRLSPTGELLSQLRLVDGSASPSPFILGSQRALAEGPAGRVYLVGHTAGPATAQLSERSGELVTPALAPVSASIDFELLDIWPTTMGIISTEVNGHSETAPADPDGLVAAIDL
jgi:hypothetical protein